MPFLWFRTWHLGVKSLLLHPLRSLLTVLGIFIGVASVVWLLAIGEGISRKAQQQIEELGATNIIIRSIKPPEESIENVGSSHSIVPYGVTRADFERLAATIPTIDRALPIREVRYRFGYLGRNIEGRLVGCTPEYADVNKLEVDRGRFLTDTDDREKWNHCALASEVAERLFPYEDPIGKAVRIERAFYLVVGVMKERTPSAGIGGSLAAQEFNDDVYIPIHTLWSRIGDIIVTRRTGSFEGEMIELSQVTLRVDKTENVLRTAALVKETLKPHHRKQDYAVVVPLELLEQARTTRLMFIVFMGLIAAISLVVGGIGIMNIMLATVTERTREIGIRRALGAKRGDIIRQFLVETIALSVMGGLTGILGGLTCRPLIAALRNLLLRAAPDVFDQLPQVIKEVTPLIVPWSVPLAFSISVTIGVIFGLYPAIRAAMMDPIEALRHE
ncbi:MAG: ABC transporter permease [Pirellulales bacterium]|nr:ABC transporter permease [Pirellulales bacterium]